MTLFERLRALLGVTGRDIGEGIADLRYGKAMVEAGLADLDRKARRLDAEAMADEWANEGGAPAGQVPNCS